AVAKAVCRQNQECLVRPSLSHAGQSEGLGRDREDALHSHERGGKGATTTKGGDGGFSQSTAESSRDRIGDWCLAVGQWPEALPGSEQAGLRALRCPGHLGAQSANLGQT